MDKQGFINYTSSFSPTGSGKAGNYAKAIDILNDIFSNVISVPLKWDELNN